MHPLLRQVLQLEMNGLHLISVGLKEIWCLFVDIGVCFEIPTRVKEQSEYSNCAFR